MNKNLKSEKKVTKVNKIKAYVIEGETNDEAISSFRELLIHNFTALIAAFRVVKIDYTDLEKEIINRQIVFYYDLLKKIVN